MNQPTVVQLQITIFNEEVAQKLDNALPDNMQSAVGSEMQDKIFLLAGLGFDWTDILCALGFDAGKEEV